MERVEFVNDLCSNYLTIPYEGEENGFSLRMMTENVANTFLPLELRRLDGEIFLYYNISGMQNMEILYGEKPIERKIFHTFMWQLHEAIEESGELFLPGDGICLEPSALFWDLGSGRWKFIYIPEGEKRMDRGLQREREALAEFLVAHIDYDDKDLMETVYRFYEEICAGKIYPDLFGKNMVSADIGKTLEEDRVEEVEMAEEEEDSDWDREISVLEAGETEGVCPIEKRHGTGKMKLIAGVLLCASLAGTFAVGRFIPDMFLPGGLVCALFAAFFIFTVLKKGSGDKGADCVPEDDIPAKWDGEFYGMEGRPERFREERKAEEGGTEEKTVFMDIKKEQERKLYGIGKFRQQNIMLNKLPCVVGKDKTMVNHRISDTSVSRMHARFFAKDDAVWMQDLNSTNGTYHNGLRLRPNEEVMLEAEDEIGFGKVEFVFR